MPTKKKPANKKKVSKNKKQNTVIVTVNSNNRRKTTSAGKVQSSNHSPPFMILQQPAPTPMPFPHQQFLPQPMISDKQIANLATAIRLPFLEDLALEQQQKVDPIRESEIRDDVQQNNRAEDVRSKRERLYGRLFRQSSFRTPKRVAFEENPMLERLQRQENLGMSNTLDLENTIPSSSASNSFATANSPENSGEDEHIYRVINPRTGRAIDYGGKTYYKMLASGYKETDFKPLNTK